MPKIASGAFMIARRLSVIGIFCGTALLGARGATPEAFQLTPRVGEELRHVVAALAIRSATATDAEQRHRLETSAH